MGTGPWTDMKVDLILFRRNNDLVPPEYLAQFAGMQVAWHKEGTHVVASAPTHENIFARVKELGIGTDEVVFGYVDGPDDPGF